MRGDATNSQKNQQPQRRKLGRYSDCVPWKIRETSVNGYSETQSSTIDLQPSEQERSSFPRRIIGTSRRCIRSCCSGDDRTIHLCQNASSPEEIH